MKKVSNSKLFFFWFVETIAEEKVFHYKHILATFVINISQ